MTTEDSTSILFVDLDGTLIKGDSLWESVAILCKKKPMTFLTLPAKLSQGRAAFKETVSQHTDLPVEALLYREGVIDFIRQKKSEGLQVVLATAAHEKIARSVVEHLDIFDDFIATSADKNLKGENKLRAMQDYAQDKPFDYMGDHTVDIPIWEASRNAYLVEPNDEIAAKAQSRENWHIVEERQKMTPKVILKAMRVHQWAKNTLLFAPLILAHFGGDVSNTLSVLIGFFAFSLCASATYLWNDLLDLHNDRKHETKSKRPLASGALPIPEGIKLSVLLTGLSVLLPILFLPWMFLLLMLGYVVLTVSYSFYFKRKLMIDVLMLAGLFTYRLIIGGVAAGVVVSPWLMAFSIFLFLSLAFAKRYSELRNAGEMATTKIAGRGYYPQDMDMVRSFGASAGYISVLVFALYMNSSVVLDLYPQPEMLWMICPCLIYWLSRLWFLANRGEMNEDPVLFSIRDKNSIGVGVLVFVLVLAASIPF